MLRAFFLEGSESKNSFNRTKQSKQPTMENQNSNMKTIILMTAMLLTVAFARPAAADKLVLFHGFFSAIDTVHPGPDGKLIVDGSGHGFSTLGKFEITFHFTVNLTTGKENGTSHITFNNGDTFDADLVGLGDQAGVEAIQVVTQLHFVTQAAGRFADFVGDFTVEAMVDIAPAQPTMFASFRGEFLKTTP
jgi:hypothetical protein